MPANLLIDDECMRQLVPAMEKAAGVIRAALASQRPVFVRFHDDCDGITSGISLVKACRLFLAANKLPDKAPGGFPALSSRQAESAILTVAGAFEDVRKFRGAPQKPLFVFADHAANAESLEALEELRSSGIGLVIIDHHPPAVEAPLLADAFVSSHPFDKTGGHTAGLLCFEVARLIAPDASKIPETWAWWSLQGDKSPLASSRHDDEPVAIDYLAQYSEKGESADYYLEKLEDRMALDLSIRLARTAEKRALEHSRAHCRAFKAENGFFIVECELGKIQHGEYPSKGKLLTLIHVSKSAELGGPVVSLGWDDEFLSVRANSAAAKMGFRAGPIIGLLKSEFPNDVISGGGHDVAASMHVSEKSVKKIADRFAELAGKAAD